MAGYELTAEQELRIGYPTYTSAALNNAIWAIKLLLAEREPDEDSSRDFEAEASEYLRTKILEAISDNPVLSPNSPQK